MRYYFILITAICFILNSCSTQNSFPQENEEIVYKSENLVVTKLSDHIYEHTSYLQTDDFGKVPCNGMIVVDKNEAIILDTPTDAKSSVELIQFVSDELNSKINAVAATHFHEDCLGGLDEFHDRNVPSYANQMTIDLLKNQTQNIPQNGFENELTLKVGDKNIWVNYFGEGHTKDNVVAYFPDEKALFGGCLIKEMNASKGYLGDSNESEWPATVSKIKAKYPEIQLVIPGHGERGGMKLLDYTIQLFKR